MSNGLKNWLFPTLSFIALLYILLLIAIWTYRVDASKPFFDSIGSKGTTTVKEFAKEMQKYVK